MRTMKLLAVSLFLLGAAACSKDKAPEAPAPAEKAKPAAEKPKEEKPPQKAAAEAPKEAREERTEEVPKEAEAPPGKPCPARWADLPGVEKGGEVTCSCAGDAFTGNVWGTSIYTADSSICRAALHLGAVPASGGTVGVKAAAGCSYYKGSEANGVQSGEWGAFDASFYFPAKGPVSCATLNDGDPCPMSFGIIPATKANAGFRCKCEATAMNGTVWGTGTYTADSSICHAALHAGAATATGGEVTVKATAGCDAYQGTDQNGVKTNDYGKFGGSFYFPAKTDGRCSAFEAGGPCPADFRAVPADKGAAGFQCVCPAGAGTGAVYGTDIYTADSNLCRAAVHAGAIGNGGGTVTVRSAPGCPAYVTTTQNGVTSNVWGAYDASYYFVGKGTGECRKADEGGPCLGFGTIPKDQADAGFACTCPPGMPTGSVYGTDIYTTDSSVCAAARHAGAIADAGGKVTVKSAPGCDKYVGTARNDVTTLSWGAYGDSFFFVDHGAGACP